MLITKKVPVKWNPHNKDHYKSKGYKYTKYGDVLNVSLDDLKGNISLNLEILCDYCGDIYYEKGLAKYYNEKEKFKNKGVVTDACKGCSPLKRKHSNITRYGKDLEEFLLDFYLRNGVKEKVRGIYYLKLDYSNTYYIGSSEDILARFGKHYGALRDNRHESKSMQEDYNRNKGIEYGILKLVDNTIDLSVIETEFIKIFTKEDKKIYNSRVDDANKNTGIKWTEDSKKRKSLAQTGKKLSEKTKRKMSLAHKGRKHSEKTKRALSVLKQGENTATAKLNSEQVEEIKLKLIENKLSAPEIAREYGVSSSSISDIKRVKTWKHVRPDLSDKLKNTVYDSRKMGSDNPDSKLTEEDVIEIKKLIQKGDRTLISIAKEFGVSGATISSIKHEKTWSHIKI